MITKEFGTTYGLRKRLCAFTPGRPRPICPKCYSLPDLTTDRHLLSGVVVVGELVVNGNQKCITETVYRCSNLECSTAIVVHACLALSPMYLIYDVIAFQLSGEEADRFEAGRHDKVGVFWAEGLAPVESAQEKPPKTRRSPKRSPKKSPKEPSSEKKPRKTNAASKRSASAESASKPETKRKPKNRGKG